MKRRYRETNSRATKLLALGLENKPIIMYSRIETQLQQLTSCMDSIQEHFEKHPKLKYICCQTRLVDL